MKHLIFYDDSCLFCQKCVHLILQLDKRREFAFAPLQGETAAKILKGKYSHLQKLNTLVLFEDFFLSSPHVWIRGKGAFRIFWLAGGVCKLLGVFCFFPSFLIDPFYRVIAHFRSHFKPLTSKEKNDARFLP